MSPVLFQPVLHAEMSLFPAGTVTCPPSLSCLAPADCWTPPADTLQARVANVGILTEMLSLP
jgi:hypothetical protein